MAVWERWCEFSHENFWELLLWLFMLTYWIRS